MKRPFNPFERSSFIYHRCTETSTQRDTDVDTHTHVCIQAQMYRETNLIKKEAEGFVVKILEMKTIWSNIDDHSQRVLLGTILGGHEIVGVHIKLCITQTQTEEWPCDWQ